MKDSIISHEQLVNAFTEAQRTTNDLSNEELIRMYQQSPDPEILERLYLQNIGLVYLVARKYSFKDDHLFQDLVQQSYFATRPAAESFDPEKGSSFATYFKYWIRQVIIRYRDENSSLVRLPAYRIEAVKAYRKAFSELSVILGQDPDSRQLAEYLNWSLTKVQDARSDMSFISMRSLSEPVSDDWTLEDTISDSGDIMASVDDAFDNDIMSNDVWTAVDELKPEQARTIRRRYIDQQTLKEIADVDGCSINNVRRRGVDALRKLRKSPILQRYKLEFYAESFAYSGGGLAAFMRTHNSPVERAVLKSEGLL